MSGKVDLGRVLGASRRRPETMAGPLVELQRLPSGRWCVVLVNAHGERRFDQSADLLTEAEARTFGNELAEFLGWPVQWSW